MGSIVFGSWLRLGGCTSFGQREPPHPARVLIGSCAAWPPHSLERKDTFACNARDCSIASCASGPSSPAGEGLPLAHFARTACHAFTAWIDRALMVVVQQEGGPQQRHRGLVRAAAAKQKHRPPQRQGGQGFGKTAEQPEATRDSEAAAKSTEAAAPGQATSTDASPAGGILASSEGSSDLPAVSRDRVFAACAQVSLLVTAIALGLRQVAPAISPAARDGLGDTVADLLNCERRCWGCDGGCPRVQSGQLHLLLPGIQFSAHPLAAPPPPPPRVCAWPAP
jgi:hypothetical protein